jgi:methyl-accepting chemotaxis protein-2 (aspartate sensor receptor)
MILFNYFANLKISKKLFLGFTLVLLVTLAIVASGLLSLKNIEDKVNKSALSVDLVNQLTTARLGRTNYQFTNDTKDLEKTEQAIELMSKTINTLELLDWSPAGKKSLFDTEQLVNDFKDIMHPFIKALEQRLSIEKLLDSKDIYEAAIFAEKLSQSGEITTEQELEASRAAFHLNNIDSLLRDYKKLPSEDAHHQLSNSLVDGISNIKKLFTFLPAEKQSKITAAVEKMNALDGELAGYRNSWMQQELLSAQLTVKSEELTQMVNSLFQLQQQIVQKTIGSSTWQTIAIALGGILLGILLAWSITRSITRPLAETLELAEQIAQGDLTSTMNSIRRDEPGLLMQAVSTMNNNLKGIIHNVREGVDSVARSSSEIAAGNMDLSARTEQQSAAVVETAASMEELTSTVALNAENANHARQLAEMASQKASEGNEISQQVIDTMKNVRSSSHRISEITTVINSIAFQTNILALNAAVEAARAGDQGKGFAVVAGEVRNLAQRSAQSAKEIEGLIHESVNFVDSGFKLVEGAGVAMADIESSVTQVRDIMSEIAAATDEQSRGISQIAQAMAEMDTTTQQNAALVEESSAAASSLEDQAVQLEKVVSIFRISKDEQVKPVAKTTRSNASSKVTKKPVESNAAEDWAEF